MSEAIENNEATTEDTVPATNTAEQQGDTVSDSVVEVAAAEPKGEATESTETTTQKTEKKDLLGDVTQQAGEEQAPEKYEPFTLADGTEMDASDVETISAIAKEHGLSQESAQKAALVAGDLMTKLVQEHEAAKEKLLEENEAIWKKQDPTGELTSLAQKACQHLGPEVTTHLKENGYTDDARIMSLLADYGRLISEGKSISGRPAQAQSLLYPNTPQLYENT